MIVESTIRLLLMIEFYNFQRIFGISVRKKERDDKTKALMKTNDDLMQQNLKLTLETCKLKKDIGKVCSVVTWGVGTCDECVVAVNVYKILCISYLVSCLCSYYFLFLFISCI